MPFSQMPQGYGGISNQDAMGASGPGGGSGDQLCPMCHQPIVMPFNTANSPNEPMPQQELPGQGGQVQPNPQELQALLQMLGGGGMR